MYTFLRYCAYLLIAGVGLDVCRESGAVDFMLPTVFQMKYRDV